MCRVILGGSVTQPPLGSALSGPDTSGETQGTARGPIQDPPYVYRHFANPFARFVSRGIAVEVAITLAGGGGGGEEDEDTDEEEEAKP
eukprot:9503810-Pyramimonas_sp.AAC.4